MTQDSKPYIVELVEDLRSDLNNRNWAGAQWELQALAEYVAGVVVSGDYSAITETYDKVYRCFSELCAHPEAQLTMELVAAIAEVTMLVRILGDAMERMRQPDQEHILAQELPQKILALFREDGRMLSKSEIATAVGVNTEAVSIVLAGMTNVRLLHVSVLGMAVMFRVVKT